MGKFLSVALILVTMILVGCGNEKTAEQSAPVETKIEHPPELEKIDAVLVAGSFWVVDTENMPFLIDALNRNDNEYLNQLILEEKVFCVDNNTKVTKIGNVTTDGNVLIQFKEGRYTNKEGRTLPYDVFMETEFPAAYLANQQQAPLQLVRSVLASTENYFDFIKTEDVEGMNQTFHFCDTVEKTLAAKAEDMQIDSATRTCMKDARRIIVNRGAAALGGLDIIKHKQASNEQKRKTAVEVTYSFSKDAIQLRQEFRNKYGY